MRWGGAGLGEGLQVLAAPPLSATCHNNIEGGGTLAGLDGAEGEDD